jgi:hypothetical protein
VDRQRDRAQAIFELAVVDGMAARRDFAHLRRELRAAGDRPGGMRFEVETIEQRPGVGSRRAPC